MKTILIFTALWIGLVALAILNAILRENVYGKTISELSAHQLSTFIFVLIIGAYTYFATKIFPLQSSEQALLVGGIWLFMTISFEFIFGHYIMGHSWHKLLNDYNLIEGRVWVVVLVWTFLAPYTLYRIQS
jgi:hypothetical protein